MCLVAAESGEDVGMICGTGATLLQYMKLHDQQVSVKGLIGTFHIKHTHIITLSTLATQVN